MLSLVWGFQLWELTVCVMLFARSASACSCPQLLPSSVPVSQNVCAEKSKKCRGKRRALPCAELSIDVVGASLRT